MQVTVKSGNAICKGDKSHFLFASIILTSAAVETIAKCVCVCVLHDFELAPTSRDSVHE